MPRITDYILEPEVVYTEGGFLVRVKVIDDYKYKKYIVSENLHYKTVQGTSFTLTDAQANKQASILELKGQTTQEGTPTPSNPIEVETVSGDNNILINNKNWFNKNVTPYKNSYYIIDNGNEISSTEYSIYKLYLRPSTKYTLTNSGRSGGPRTLLF